jgi:hypothetical protein
VLLHPTGVQSIARRAQQIGCSQVVTVHVRRAFDLELLDFGAPERPFAGSPGRPDPVSMSAVTGAWWPRIIRPLFIGAGQHGEAVEQLLRESSSEKGGCHAPETTIYYLRTQIVKLVARDRSALSSGRRPQRGGEHSMPGLSRSLPTPGGVLDLVHG